MAIPAASGYPQYSGNLIHPKFSSKLISRFYCSSVFADISTTEYSGDLKSCGDQITFFKEPEVVIGRLEKDGKIEHQTLVPESVTMTINDRLYFSVKVDMDDEDMMCNWETWKEAFMKRATYNMKQLIDKELLTKLYAEVDPRSKGTTSAGYNFGAPTAPLALTSTNILQVLSQINAQLCTLCSSGDDMFIVLPCEAQPLLMNSPILGQAYASGLNESTLLTGKAPRKIAGFDVYFSTNVGTVADGPLPVFLIIAGRKDSTAFAINNEGRFRVLPDKDSPDHFYQGFLIYGEKVIRKEGLAALYATLA